MTIKHRVPVLIMSCFGSRWSNGQLGNCVSSSSLRLAASGSSGHAEESLMMMAVFISEGVG